jgi:hypothetical protein
MERTERDLGGKDPPGRSITLEVGIAALVVVLLAFLAATRIDASGGTVSLTAFMAPFSPNPVRVKDTASSVLTAEIGTDYSPPVPSGDEEEGALTYSYDWSLTQVQYKALQADSFGPAPSGSYTDSISPSQPSTGSSASLDFTPLIAGYWAISTSCTVTVTDTNNKETWTGSQNAGPEDLTSVAVDLTVTVSGTQLSETQEENPGVTLSVEPQYQHYFPGEPTPVFTATSAPADCTVTLNWNNASDVLAQSTAGVTLTAGQQIPAKQGAFNFYAYATPSFTNGQVDFSVTAEPPTGGSVRDP